VLSNAHDILLYYADQALISRNYLFDGKTILHIAALNSDIPTVTILSRFTNLEIDPYSRDHAGCTALDYIRQSSDSDQIMGPFSTLVSKTEADNMRSKLTSFYEAGASDSEEDTFFDALEDPSFD
jgi:hypothetical protein